MENKTEFKPSTDFKTIEYKKYEPIYTKNESSTYKYEPKYEPKK